MLPTPSTRSTARRILGALSIALVLAASGARVAEARAATIAARAGAPVAADAVAARDQLGTGKAIVLGLVEGITEFLPISSTGHLSVAEHLLDVGTTPGTKDATDAYTVIIQVGAILAVVLLYWRRILDVLAGLVGRSATGRRLLVALVVAFLPAGVIGKLFSQTIEDHLLKPSMVAVAWAVGGLAILALARRYRGAMRDGRALETITAREALVIGLAQSLALWPGVSRSLVTILAAVLLGLSLPAAVEFGFLLGLCTLGAATAYSLAKDGSTVFDTFGTSAPLIGIVVAFVSAAAAVKWMVGYLDRHDLTVFAWYRLAAAAVTVGLLATHVI